MPEQCLVEKQNTNPYIEFDYKGEIFENIQILADEIIKADEKHKHLNIKNTLIDILKQNTNTTKKYLFLNGTGVDIDKVTETVDKINLSNIVIDLQSAPISEVGINGLQIDDVIVVIKNILQSFQNRFPCEETAEAINHLAKAKEWCDIRTANRRKRGVEGTSQV